MEIIKEKFTGNKWTEALNALIIKEDCLVADLVKYPSIRQQATKLSIKSGKKFSFRTYKVEDVVKVWRIK